MEHRPLIDALTGLMIEKKETVESLTITPKSDEEIQGLKYRKGQKVIDTVTGKEVTVIAGKRAVGTL